MFAERFTLQPRRRAFTLVELLVVIGIIALLISILLPALNRARQSANATVCLSNMRQMGQAVNLYANDNDGSAPWGTSPRIETEPGAHYYPRWFETISGYIGSDVLDDYNGESRATKRQPVHPIFSDVDTNSYEGAYGPSGAGVNHYMANIRIFGEFNASDLFRDPTAPFDFVATPKKLGSVRDAANTAAVWDSNQLYFSRTDVHPIFRGSADATSRYMDPHAGWGPHGRSGAFYAEGFYNVRDYVTFTPRPDDHEGTKVGSNFKEDIGSPQRSDGNPLTSPGIRTRHMDNEVANVLFHDGHVEGKRENELTRRLFTVTQ